MRRPALNLLRVPAGHAEYIGSIQTFYNIGQYEGMHEKYYRSLWANLSTSEADSHFITLANTKACVKYIIGPFGPTRAYRKQTANLQHWPMRRPALNLLRVPAGHAERIGSGRPCYNIGQYEGMHEKYYRSLWANLSTSEADSHFITLANMKACMKRIIGPGGPN